MMTCLAVRSLLLLSSACYLACASVLPTGDEVRYMKLNTKAHGHGLGIVGGQRARIKDMPYYATFVNKDDMFDTTNGAVIIHERFVLTTGAAVIYHITDVSKFQLAVGRDDLLRRGAIYDLKKTFVHPNISLSDKKYANDIAVIQLMRKIKFGEYVWPIKMADSSLVLKPGDQLTVMGFGQTDDAVLPRFLQFVNVPYYDYDKCAELTKKYGIHITKSIMCAAGVGDGKGFCFDDYGDPLVYNNNTVVGLMSVLALPCGGSLPDLCSNIASARPFIDGVIKSEL